MEETVYFLLINSIYFHKKKEKKSTKFGNAELLSSFFFSKLNSSLFKMFMAKYNVTYIITFLNL